MKVKKLPSGFLGQWLFNRALWRMIPFNRSLRVKVECFEPQKVICRLPFKNSNCNHLKGLHACALATVAEYAAGLLLVQSFHPRKYRIIMAELNVSYKVQGKSDVLATCEITSEDIEHLKIKMCSDGQARITLESVIVEEKTRKKLVVCQTLWQVKPWQHLKNK